MIQHWPIRAFHPFDHSECLRDGQRAQARPVRPNAGKMKLRESVERSGAAGSCRVVCRRVEPARRKAEQRWTGTDNRLHSRAFRDTSFSCKWKQFAENSPSYTKLSLYTLNDQERKHFKFLSENQLTSTESIQCSAFQMTAWKSTHLPARTVEINKKTKPKNKSNHHLLRRIPMIQNEVILGSSFVGFPSHLSLKKKINPQLMPRILTIGTNTF